MIRRHRGFSTLLVAFCLLASAAMAHAECAWVLWQEIAVGEPRMEEVWTLRDASDSLDGCRSHAKSAVARIKWLFQVPDSTITARTWEFGYELAGKYQDGSSATRLVNFLCLPDTVDPRGPKRK